MTQHYTSRVWQEQSVIAIIESVFAGYPEQAAWTWSNEVATFMSDARPRSFSAPDAKTRWSQDAFEKKFDTKL